MCTFDLWVSNVFVFLTLVVTFSLIEPRPTRPLAKMTLGQDYDALVLDCLSNFLGPVRLKHADFFFFWYERTSDLMHL